MNHVSLILGIRLSGAYCQTFAHNGKEFFYKFDLKFK